MYPDDFLERKLALRKENHSLRALQLADGKIDFCSNDYLGVVFHSRLLSENRSLASGSTGSRLLSGNYPLIEATEKKIAGFHGAESGLLFNSGYDANLGLLSSVPQKGDTILYDQLSHASIRDGIRLSFARHVSFAHNDMADLENKLRQATGTLFIVTESVFSMDGDLCPLQDLVRIAAQYNAHLIIDEAHATGVLGKQGAGLVQELGLEKKIFARIHTFGKALGCHGAIVLGSTVLQNYLINFARSFVFSTSLPEHSVDLINRVYTIFPEMDAEREQLGELIKQFRQAAVGFETLRSETPIQGVLVPGNDAVKKVAALLQQENLDVRPILYPTVPLGSERLRIVLHSFNTKADLAKLISLLAEHGSSISQ
jgi:8-amino-7-oxononanoate synthase